ncbi:MAG: flagellar hook assembly protein FlgD [Deltaproteobacteria bacterium]|jgi:flagellar basal-body rod modification protein FlgD|nr:flagellar hook assembly protein FlgD [Deltaproteobacteria bacterium]
MVQIYSADNPPPARTTPLEAWTNETVPVTDGSERQLGKDAFLTLLLTQLQNQDPFNPMEDTEMSAQLAQFSQLEQLTNLNTNVTTMGGYIQAQNQFQTLSLIGKDVKAQSNLLSVSNGELDTAVKLELAENAKIQLYVVNSSGNQVRMYDWGMTQAGVYDFAWDGKNSSGAKVPDGLYQFQVTATNSAGEVMTEGIIPEVSGKVTSVSFDEYGQPVVHIGNAQMSLSQVMEILQGGVTAKAAEEEESEAPAEKETAKAAEESAEAEAA